MTQHAVDWLRMIVFAQSSIVFWLTALILYRYSRVRFTYVDKSRKIPLYILALAISHVLGTFFISYAVVERLGQPITWRLPLAFVIFVLGDVALWITDSHVEDQLNRRY